MEEPRTHGEEKSTKGILPSSLKFGARRAEARRRQYICRDHRIDYVELDTSTKLDVALSTYLAARAGSLRR